MMGTILSTSACSRIEIRLAAAWIVRNGAARSTSSSSGFEMERPLHVD
jgi:hypothetical protein